MPDAHWGEAVHAVVVPAAGRAAEPIVVCRRHIAEYKVPKDIDFQTEPLPKSGPGKILKRELRAPHWSGRDTLVSGT